MAAVDGLINKYVVVVPIAAIIYLFKSQPDNFWLSKSVFENPEFTIQDLCIMNFIVVMSLTAIISL